MKLRLLTFLFLFCFSNVVFAEGPEIKRIDPTNWWVGMKNPKLQLLVYGEDIGKTAVSLKKYKGVSLENVTNIENPNYIFLDLLISSKAAAGQLEFHFHDGNKEIVRKYELKTKEKVRPQTLNPSDVIYLIMPDRFSNGDPLNDKFNDMADTASDRSNPWLRHGGDLQGIINHLDYITDLGVTALWLNPVIENDQPQTNEGGNMRSAYHGYGFTDHYSVDRRLGGNAKYKEFVDIAHSKGLKVVQDAVYNHVGINHYFIKDLPMKSWLNQWDTYTNTSYKEQAVLDPNASEYDKSRVTDGWFMPFLPDLNQRNPLVANYLIQHALWTVQNFGIDAYRIDTYMYNDMEFMNYCNQALKTEFPEIFLFGESLANPVPNVAAFVKNNMELPFACNLESTVDYQSHKAILTSLNENFGWNEGVNRLYQTLVQDYLYQNPEKLVTYLDNHDEDRFFSVVGEDYRKFKMGLIWLMTLRGIPEIYYGTEILTKNFKNPTDAEVRKDFPGGWTEDKVDKFSANGRSDIENETFEFTKALINLRKESKAIGEGKFLQFQPFDNGIYAYFRYTRDETILVVSNVSEAKKEVNTQRFTEILKGRIKATNALSGNEIENITTLQIQPFQALILKIHD